MQFHSYPIEWPRTNKKGIQFVKDFLPLVYYNKIMNSFEINNLLIIRTREK